MSNWGDFCLNEHGFELRPGFCPAQEIAAINSALAALTETLPSHGIRHIEKKLPSIHRLIHSPRLLRIAARHLGGQPSVVRAIVFDKSPAANWLVTWHQDRTVAVSQQMDVPGWGPWSVKEGVVHVQPSVEVLQQMITLRLHLDDTDERNGCLKLIPGSHRHGLLCREDQDKLVTASSPVLCKAAAGDLLVMRPLLLHASSRGTAPARRRILHVEYSNVRLPTGLGWG